MSNAQSAEEYCHITAGGASRRVAGAPKICSIAPDSRPTTSLGGAGSSLAISGSVSLLDSVTGALCWGDGGMGGLCFGTGGFGFGSGVGSAATSVGGTAGGGEGGGVSDVQLINPPSKRTRGSVRLKDPARR
jgi:hypothetical protein